MNTWQRFCLSPIQETTNYTQTKKHQEYEEFTTKYEKNVVCVPIDLWDRHTHRKLALCYFATSKHIDCVFAHDVIENHAWSSCFLLSLFCPRSIRNLQWNVPCKASVCVFMSARSPATPNYLIALEWQDRWQNARMRAHNFIFYLVAATVSKEINDD